MKEIFEKIDKIIRKYLIEEEMDNFTSAADVENFLIDFEELRRTYEV